MGANGKIRLQEAVNLFEASLRARNKSYRTIKTHTQPLSRMVKELGNIQVSSLNTGHMDRLLTATAADWSWSTRNLYMDNLRGKRGFFSFCRLNGWMARDSDPLALWDRQKGEHRERKWIPVDEFVDLLDACVQPRDRAVVALGLFTLSRGSEVSGLTWDRVDFSANTVKVYREKTREWAVLPMSLELREELLAWKHHYLLNLEVTEVQPDWFVVPAKHPLEMRFDPELGKLQPTGAPGRLKPTKRLAKPYDPVKRAMECLGLDTYGSGMHVCRRSGGRAMFDQLRGEGYDGAMMRVSRLLGHKSVKQTEHYLGIELEQEQLIGLLAGKPMFGDAVLGRKNKNARILGVSRFTSVR